VPPPPPPPLDITRTKFVKSCSTCSKLIFGIKPYSNPTRRNNNLNFFEMEDGLIFFKWKTTSIFLVN
jgi:hypothetical protein